MLLELKDRISTLHYFHLKQDQRSETWSNCQKAVRDLWIQYSHLYSNPPHTTPPHHHTTKCKSSYRLLTLLQQLVLIVLMNICTTVDEQKLSESYENPNSTRAPAPGTATWNHHRMQATPAKFLLATALALTLLLLLSTT